LRDLDVVALLFCGTTIVVEKKKNAREYYSLARLILFSEIQSVRIRKNGSSVLLKLAPTL
jgi:hypothetical protein